MGEKPIGGRASFLRVPRSVSGGDGGGTRGPRARWCRAEAASSPASRLS